MILWSDDTSEFWGSISAQGGPNGGDGGFAELSGKRLTASGNVDLSALQGNVGTVLLDPQNIVITNGAAPPNTATTTYLSSSYVEALSNMANVDLAATNDFTVEKLSDNKLLFQRGRSVTFTADSDGDLLGEFIMQDLTDWIDADRGNISIFGAGITAGRITTDTIGSTGENGGNVTLISSRGVTVDRVSTTAYFDDNNAGNGGQVRIEASNGDIAVRDFINTWSHSNGKGRAGNAGDIELLASNNIWVKALDAGSVGDKDSSGAGGQILLRAEGGDVSVTRDIISESKAAGEGSAGTGGNVTIEAANNIDIAGEINTSSTAKDSSTGNAGSVSLTAGSGIETKDIEAVSTGGGSNGDIFLTGDRIDLRGGDRSVAGKSIWFVPASQGTDLNIGISLKAGSTLDISKTDLKAIAAADSINIGRADSTGSVSLFSEEIESVSEQFPIRILGGETLVASNVDNNWIINGLNSGSVNGISFENIGKLQGGEQQDTFTFQANGNFTDTITGGLGIDTIDFLNSQLSNVNTAFFEIENIIGMLPPVEPELPIEVEVSIEPELPIEVEVSIEPELPIEVELPIEPELPIEVELPIEPELPIEVEIPIELELPIEVAVSIGSGLIEKPTQIENTTKDIVVPPSSNLPTPTLEGRQQAPTSAITNTLDKNLEAPSTTIDLSRILQNEATETAVTADLFNQIEVGVGKNFRNYLGLSEANGQVETIGSVQARLQEVETATGITPALIYAYFVPDARSQSAVVTGSDRPAQPNDQLEVMLITKEGSPIRKRQWGITREQVDAVSQNMRQQVTSQFSTARQYLEPAQQLYDWLIRPIEKDLAAHSVESLGFVMDDGLRTLPIAALHDGDRYLVEKYSVGLLPSFSLTAFEKTEAERIDFANAQVLAMGASEFKDQPPLPAVSAEIDLITQQLWQGDAFLNEDFVLKNLQNQIKQKEYGIVHLATHASFEAGNLENSYIQMWDDKLSLTDVKELGLDSSDIGLIILSACNTALGDRASEYGFAGFAVTAGSQSALASLWPVSDEGTLGFMSQFYKELKQSPIRAEALRQAQLSLIRGDVGVSDGLVYGPDDSDIAILSGLAESGRWDFSHPFYWSAFTMIGNPW